MTRDRPDTDRPPNAAHADGAEAMPLAACQQVIDRIYRERDAERGAAMNYLWLTEEVGELARAVRRHLLGKRGASDEANLREEFADVLAWLLTIASDVDVDLAAAFADRYGQGCPYCRATPCACPAKGRPKPSDDTTA